jgi:DNA adenine methylase
MDYGNIVKIAREGDFVYLDPPYQPLSQTSSFTSYTETGFDLEEQVKLGQVFDRLDERGCLVLESNSSSPEIREIYRVHYQTPVMAARAINVKADGRKPIEEIAITNFEPRPVKKVTLDRF